MGRDPMLLDYVLVFAPFLLFYALKSLPARLFFAGWMCHVGLTMAAQDWLYTADSYVSFIETNWVNFPWAVGLFVVMMAAFAYFHYRHKLVDAVNTLMKNTAKLKEQVLNHNQGDDQ